MFQTFFSSLVRSNYFFHLFVVFHLHSCLLAKSTRLEILFSCWLKWAWSSNRDYFNFTPLSFSHERLLRAFHVNLSNSDSPQITRTLLSILVYLYNDVVWMVSTRALFFNSSCPFTNPFVTVRITITDFHIYQPLRSGRIWHKVNF